MIYRRVSHSAANTRRAGPGARRARGRDPRRPDAGRGPALPPRPVHAARARGARAPLADRPAPRRGRSLRRDRRAGTDLDGDGHARRAVAPSRNRWVRPRPRSAQAEAPPMSVPFTRAGENGRLKLAVPAKGRLAEPSLRLCADAGLSFEVTERSLVVPCANAPVDLLLVRPSDIPEYAQDGVVDLGITGANLVVEADADVVTLAELGFGRCRLDAAVPVDAPSAGDRGSRRPARRHGVPVVHRAPPRRARHHLRARSGLRLGRGDAEAGSCRRDRRPRVDRLDDGRERPAAGGDAARLPGGPRRWPRGRRGPDESSSNGSS